MKHRLSEAASQRLAAGHILLQAEDFQRSDNVSYLSEGEIILLIDADKQFVGKAIIGRQNKGLAWVFTQEEFEYWDSYLFTDRIQTAVAKRQAFFGREETTAFRLFNGEGDGLGGLTIDYYDGFLQVNWYSRGIYQSRQEIIDALLGVLTDIKGIYETKRFELEDHEHPILHTYGQTAPQPLIIKENQVQYGVYLGQDWMTGIFLDQREVRNFVKTQGAGASILNLFSYTGAFSVAAALGGAEATVSVDVANRSLDRTQEQFALNGLAIDQHEIRVMDVFSYLDYARKHQVLFDMVVCDPPSFAQTKGRQFSSYADYTDLADQVFDVTKPGGYAILSTNHAGYPLEEFRSDMMTVGLQHAGKFQLIHSFGLPEDFPTSQDELSSYLKVLVMYRSQ